MSRKGVVMAPRKRECRICQGLSPREVTVVNAVIWPEGPDHGRSRTYRADAVRAAAAQGLEIEAKTVTRHAEHIEASWHTAIPDKPVPPGEVAVMPTDYDSVMSRMAGLGMAAATRLAERVPVMDDRELVSLAKTGLSAAAQREALRIRQQEGKAINSLAEALFGLSGGVLREEDVPEVEVIDVTPPEVMLDEVRAERAALKMLQSGKPLVDAAAEG